MRHGGQTTQTPERDGPSDGRSGWPSSFSRLAWACSSRFCTSRPPSEQPAGAVERDRPRSRRDAGRSRRAVNGSPDWCRGPADLWLGASVVLTCGALTTGIVLAPQAGGSPDIGLAWLLFLGSSVHVASTGWLFTNSDVRRFAWRQRGRYVWAPLGLVATGVLLSGIVSPRFLSWAVLLVLAWQLHHFQKQNIGQVVLAGASLGLAPVSRCERTAICATGAAAIAAVCAHPALLQLDVQPPLAQYVAFSARVFLFLGLAGGTLALASRHRSDRPPRFCAMYGLALLFPLPVFVCSSPYAAVAGMTMAHGFQYVLLMGLVAAGNAPRKRRGGVAALCVLAVPGGDVAESEFSSARRWSAVATVLRGLSRPPRRPFRGRCRHVAPP